jgi:hypothetical protein
VYAIIISGIGSCLNFSSSAPIYELLSEIRVVGGSLAPIRNSPNVNFMYIFNVTIPNAPLAVEAYESMLSSCVSSGRYTAYIQSAAANTPNSTALLHASSSSVTFGDGSRIQLRSALFPPLTYPMVILFRFAGYVLPTPTLSPAARTATASFSFHQVLDCTLNSIMRSYGILNISTPGILNCISGHQQCRSEV